MLLKIEIDQSMDSIQLNEPIFGEPIISPITKILLWFFYGNESPKVKANP